MNHSSRDAGIPVLTEIISEPVAQSILENRPAIESKPSAPFRPQAASVEALSERARAEWSDDEWNRLEQSVRKHIVDQMLARIDSLLEDRIRDALADILQVAVGTLANDVRNGLRDSLDDAIAPAIAAELKRLQASEI